MPNRASLRSSRRKITRTGRTEVSALAEWIREATKKRRERLLEQGYREGYADAQQGKPPRFPSQDNSNRKNESVRDSRMDQGGHPEE